MLRKFGTEIINKRLNWRYITGSSTDILSMPYMAERNNMNTNITLKKIESATTTLSAVEIDAKSNLAERFPWPQEINDILEGVRKNAFVVVNNHTRKPEVSRIGVWLHRNGKESSRIWEEWHVVWLPKDGSMCCLNPIYHDDDGIPHLSTASVGDNVWAGWPSSYHPERNIQEGMAAYNWMYLESEEAHGHPRTLVEGCTPFYDNRLLYCEGRHEKYYWNEDHEEVIKFRY